ncbi:hypothetical protein N7340_00255 [Comamonas aquatica]|uniref:hypothetical protein n=1 Tax=Comamonas aquatica TaxID=225991 RepID=UPI002447D440|nr:hypothetical protein [Comamonas aquatica]MDH0370224.1 hypothetical protein [Comamonas aquatica]
MEKFEIPIVLFVFKRSDTVVKIIDRLSTIKPRKIYILSDGGRTLDEKKLVSECRQTIENAIDWDCEVVKKYEENNIGVYANIALGARWVFSKEDVAIFLEDDNLPEITFFKFCSEILDKYHDDERVLWVCGTNYLKEYFPENGASYIFTKNMMPCGWASWGGKFLKYYDGELLLWKDREIRKSLKKKYFYKPLYYQDRYNIEYELDAFEKNKKFFSWDYQMSFSMRVHDVYAIVPQFNQIENIGVDVYSTHGGNSYVDVMVQRFCGLKTKPMNFPLIHPKNIEIDEFFEKSVAKIILHPEFFSIRSIVSRIIRRLFSINKTDGVKSFFIKNFLK